MTHERLKSRRGITEPKEHYSGFKEAERHDEHHFPLVFLPDVNVVIAPSNIKLGEQGRVLHIVDQLWDEEERISIADSVGVVMRSVQKDSWGLLSLDGRYSQRD